MSKVIEKHSVTIGLVTLATLLLLVFSAGEAIGEAKREVKDISKRVVKLEGAVKDVETLKADVRWIKEAIKRMEKQHEK